MGVAKVLLSVNLVLRKTILLYAELLDFIKFELRILKIFALKSICF